MRLNRKANMAKDPLVKCTYFLGLLKGKDTDGWILQQDKWLEVVERDPFHLSFRLNT